jgi:D-glycero-alpha-D-manno-heptose 1-phosphate guanylyltransferase
MISNIITDTAIILAGGLGSRIKELNPDSPKPMALVNNIPFLEYLLIYLISLGIKIFILQVSFKYKVIQDYFGNSFKGSKIIYEVEDIPMGTGGGLIITDNKYNEGNILVLNGDTFTEFDYPNFFDFHTKNNNFLSLICRKNIEIKTSFKFSLDIDSKIFFSTNDMMINAGVYLIKKNVISKFLKLNKNFLSFENDILIPLIKDEQVYGYEQDSFFIDIGTPVDYKKVQYLLPEYLKKSLDL